MTTQIDRYHFALETAQFILEEMDVSDCFDDEQDKNKLLVGLAVAYKLTEEQTQKLLNTL